MDETVGVFQSARNKTRSNVLQLEGEIDLHISPQVAKKLRTMMQSKPKMLVVDLAKVTFLDSSGLGVLTDAMQEVHECGGKFGLADVKESVQYLFQQANLDQVFQIFPDIDAALAAH